MNTASALMFLTAETSIHAGSGQSVAGIDLPIQREVHTQWPCVYGSAVKGAMRSRATLAGIHGGTKVDIVDLFGPEHAAAAGERDSSHAGALQIGDARLLLLPVRSLNTCFKWVTCPAILRRLQRDALRMGLDLPEIAEFKLNEEQACAAKGEDAVFLEEFRLQTNVSESVAQWVPLLSKSCGLTEAELQDRLLVVHDDVFSFLARHATAVNAHIAIDSESKTVRSGALWYEETLPPETVLYVPVNATASRRKGTPRAAAAVLEEMLTLFGDSRQWLQIGGNETTGMGWCKVTVSRSAAAHTGVAP